MNTKSTYSSFCLQFKMNSTSSILLAAKMLTYDTLLFIYSTFFVCFFKFCPRFKFASSYQGTWSGVQFMGSRPVWPDVPWQPVTWPVRSCLIICWLYALFVNKQKYFIYLNKWVLIQNIKGRRWGPRQHLKHFAWQTIKSSRMQF